MSDSSSTLMLWIGLSGADGVQSGLNMMLIVEKDQIELIGFPRRGRTELFWGLRL